jgi:hypothetical protein
MYCTMICSSRHPSAHLPRAALDGSWADGILTSREFLPPLTRIGSTLAVQRGTPSVLVDEIYVGVDRNGRQFIIPVQAKGGNDRHAVVQTQQDITYCLEKFPNLICRAVSAQFMSEDRIAMFELVLQENEIRVAEEKHYRLVPSSEISIEDLHSYAL